MLNVRAGANLVSMSVVTHPCREELEALVRHYHHLQSEHERARPQGSGRHHLQIRLERTRQRFEHVLVEYVPDEAARRAWKEFLHHRGPEPPGPPAITPVVFKGRSDAGSLVMIHRDRRGELAVEVDGQLVQRIPDRVLPIAGVRPTTLRINEVSFREVFDADPRAVRALREFRATGGDPPWEHVSQLLGDGLVDLDLALTARGRRLLAGAG